jgi:release factor glutamine methyltransferase
VADAARRLAAAGVADPAGDARRLARWAAGLTAAALAARLDALPGAEERARFEAAVARRAARVPLSQITGSRDFWGRAFRVTPDVLDPRPETETLVAAALEGPAPGRLLDLGTGSGCLLVTLLAEWPESTGVGVDRSRAALAVAAENARAHGVAERATLLAGDWYAPVSGRFDLIVANPPYITEAEHAGLAPELRLHEPRGALVGGPDGLDAYRAIAAGAPDRLAPGGRLLVEIGAGQAEAVARIFRAAGLDPAPPRTDLDGRPRVIPARVAA